MQSVDDRMIYAVASSAKILNIFYLNTVDNAEKKLKIGSWVSNAGFCWDNNKCFCNNTLALHCKHAQSALKVNYCGDHKKYIS